MSIREQRAEKNGKMVPKEGVEPSCPRGRQILSLVRLPFRHFGNELVYNNTVLKKCKPFRKNYRGK